MNFVQNLGKIVAPASPSAWRGLDASQWLAFNGVSGLHITGHGAIDGRGSGWWNQSCRDHQGLVLIITLVTIFEVHSQIFNLYCSVSHMPFYYVYFIFYFFRWHALHWHQQYQYKLSSIELLEYDSNLFRKNH